LIDSLCNDIPINVCNECFLRYNYFILDTFHRDILYFKESFVTIAWRVLRLGTEETASSCIG
jgi:hypothetical protein